MKKYIIIYLFSVCLNVVTGQSKTSDSLLKNESSSDSLITKFKRYSVGFYPLTLIEPENGIRASFEIPITSNFSLQPDINFISVVPKLNFVYANVTNMVYHRGIVCRLDFKKYVYSGKVTRIFLSPEIMYKLAVIKYLQPDNLGYNAYSEYEYKNVFSANIKIGMKQIIPGNKSIDFYAGSGIRIPYTTYLMSDGSTINYNDLPYKNPYLTSILPNFILGFSLNYDLEI